MLGHKGLWYNWRNLILTVFFTVAGEMKAFIHTKQNGKVVYQKVMMGKRWFFLIFLNSV